MSDNLFFRVYEGTIDNEVLVFDQLDLNSRINNETGLPYMLIGEPIVTVDR